MDSVLNHPGWIAFNEEKWGLRSRQVMYGDRNGSGAFAMLTLYLNAAGKIRTPKRLPYHAVEFRPTPTTAPQKQERQWLDAGAHLAEAMDGLGFAGAFSLAPSVTDVRPWQWRGHRAEVRYTYVIELPYNLGTATNAVRKNIKKAERAQYCCERTRDFGAVVDCLRATQSRQRFDYGVDARDLRRLEESVGEEHVRAYVCRAAKGEVVSARVVLHAPGTEAIDWVAGTVSEHLQMGVTQQLIHHVLSDLHAAGATSFDYGGANIPHVARSKAEWGGRLVPFYTIRPRNLRTIAQDASGWLSAFAQTIKGHR